jgi:hypothetical protein
MGHRMPAVLLVLAGAVLFALPACSASDPPTCTGSLQAYRGRCLDSTTIDYVGCTQDRGFDLTKKISGGLGGTFKSVAGLSVQAAYSTSKTEDTPVALQVVHDCLTLAQRSAVTGSDRSAAAGYASTAQDELRNFQAQVVAGTPHIKLSRPRAAVGQRVTVTGTSFWGNETVAVDLGATLLTQVRVDRAGGFRTAITVPPDAPPPSFSTDIVVSGESSSLSALAPFRTMA